MARTVYLTCELKSRDLDSRLLIACHLLKAGLDVVIGQQWSIFQNLASCPKGAVLFKTPNRIQSLAVRAAKAAGHMSIVMDEEAVVIVDAHAMRLSTDPDIFDLADTFLFQNEQHRSFFADEPGIIAGSARVDIARTMRDIYRAEADAYRQNGRYVLINTNYGLSNSIWGPPKQVLNQAAIAWNADLADPLTRAYFQGWTEAETQAFRGMQKFISYLQPQLKTHRLIVRPHPAEKTDVWQKLKGLEIVQGSDPAPWILGADITVHTNSTTGLEAALLGCTCLNLNLTPTSAFSRTFATNSSAFQVSSVREAVDATLEVLSGKHPVANNNWVPSFPEHGAARIATEIVSRAVDGPAITSWKKTPRAPIEQAKFDAKFDDVRNRLSVIGAHLDLPSAAGAVLDDSLFLFRRTG